MLFYYLLRLGKLKRLGFDKTKHPPCWRGRSVTNAHQGIMRAKLSAMSAEGGNRTLIPVGNTILSRARLPVPPLRQ